MRRGDPSFSGARYQAWIAASGYALLAMTGPLLTYFSPSSRGAQRRGDPSFSGAQHPAWIGASGYALLARAKFIFTPLRNDRAQADLTSARPSLMTKIG